MAGFSFPRDRRLTHPNEFKHVFERGRHRRFNSEGFILRVREQPQDNNAQALTHKPEARLGLAIAKRSLKRAVDRNRVKRLVRESFRQHYATLPALDIVVLAQPSLKNTDNRAILGQLSVLWADISERYVSMGGEAAPRHKTFNP